jgi:hypothetical protein
MSNKISGAFFFLMGLMLVLVPRYILPVCEYQGFSPMSCSHTAFAEMFTGFIVMALSAGLAFSKGRESLRWFSLPALAAGISVLWIPRAIGYCHSSGMPCNYATMPVLRLLGVLIILVSCGSFLFSFRREKP